MFKGVITRDEWGARPPTQNSGPQGYGQGLVLHWEGPSMWGDLWAFAHASCYEKVRGIQSYHINVGYSDIAYNDIVCPHGYVFQGRSGVGMANAASGNWDVNHNTEAVCFLWGVGDTVLENNRDPIDALNAIRNYVIAFAGAGDQVVPHRAVQGVSTSCPGDELAYIAGLLNGSAPQPFASEQNPTPSPTPTPTPAPDSTPVMQRGDNGLHVAEWQIWLNDNTNAGLDVDGDFGAKTEQAVVNFKQFWSQYNPTIVVNGVIEAQAWDLRHFVEFLKTQPPAPTPTPAPVPTPTPTPTPDPVPTPSPQRILSDGDVQIIIEKLTSYLNWSFIGKSRQAKLNAFSNFLKGLKR